MPCKNLVWYPKVVNVTGVERGRARIGGGSNGSASSLYAPRHERALGKYMVLVQIFSIFPARSPADQMCLLTNNPNTGRRRQAGRGCRLESGKGD